jgi:hypothetical protein
MRDQPKGLTPKVKLGKHGHGRAFKESQLLGTAWNSSLQRTLLDRSGDRSETIQRTGTGPARRYRLDVGKMPAPSRRMVKQVVASLERPSPFEGGPTYGVDQP